MSATKDFYDEIMPFFSAIGWEKRNDSNYQKQKRLVMLFMMAVFPNGYKCINTSENPKVDGLLKKLVYKSEKVLNNEFQKFVSNIGKHHGNIENYSVEMTSVDGVTVLTSTYKKVADDTSKTLLDRSRLDNGALGERVSPLITTKTGGYGAISQTQKNIINTLFKENLSGEAASFVDTYMNLVNVETNAESSNVDFTSRVNLKRELKNGKITTDSKIIFGTHLPHISELKNNFLTIYNDGFANKRTDLHSVVENFGIDIPAFIAEELQKTKDNVESSVKTDLEDMVPEDVVFDMATGSQWSRDKDGNLVPKDDSNFGKLDADEDLSLCLVSGNAGSVAKCIGTLTENGIKLRENLKKLEKVGPSVARKILSTFGIKIVGTDVKLADSEWRSTLPSSVRGNAVLEQYLAKLVEVCNRSPYILTEKYVAGTVPTASSSGVTPSTKSLVHDISFVPSMSEIELVAFSPMTSSVKPVVMPELPSQISALMFRGLKGGFSPFKLNNVLPHFSEGSSGSQSGGAMITVMSGGMSKSVSVASLFGGSPQVDPLKAVLDEKIENLRRAGMSLSAADSDKLDRAIRHHGKLGRQLNKIAEYLQKYLELIALTAPKQIRDEITVAEAREMVEHANMSGGSARTFIDLASAIESLRECARVSLEKRTSIENDLLTKVCGAIDTVIAGGKSNVIVPV